MLEQPLLDTVPLAGPQSIGYESMPRFKESLAGDGGSRGMERGM